MIDQPAEIIATAVASSQRTSLEHDDVLVSYHTTGTEKLSGVLAQSLRKQCVEASAFFGAIRNLSVFDLRSIQYILLICFSPHISTCIYCREQQISSGIREEVLISTPISVLLHACTRSSELRAKVSLNDSCTPASSRER